MYLHPMYQLENICGQNNYTCHMNILLERHHRSDQSQTFYNNFEVI